MLFRNNLLRFNRFMGGGGSRSQFRNQSPRQYGPSYPPPTEQDPPVARITTGKTTVSVGTEVSFDGSKSTGSGLKYSWNLGDGANPATATTPQTSCTYSSTGEKTVSLIVTDDRGVKSEPATLTITVIELSLDGYRQIGKGTNMTYTATVEPAGLNVTYNWKFTAEGSEIPGPSGSITSGPSGSITWGGQMVVSGTVEVTVDVNNQSFTKSLTTKVLARLWVDDYPVPPIRNAGQGTLPPNPTELGHLGLTVQTSNIRILVFGDAVTAGPNAGWMFVTTPPVGLNSWNMVAYINRALTNKDHAFYQCNLAEYPQYTEEPEEGSEEVVNYMTKLLRLTELHEGTKREEGIESHASHGLNKIRECPLNPWADRHVQYSDSINDPALREGAIQDFEGDVAAELTKRAKAVQKEFKKHPTNVWDIPLPIYPDYDNLEDKDEEDGDEE